MSAIYLSFGAFALTFSFGLFVWSIEEHPRYGSSKDRWWRAPTIIGLLGFGVALLIYSGVSR